jgi:hypothetical protein
LTFSVGIASVKSADPLEPISPASLTLTVILSLLPVAIVITAISPPEDTFAFADSSLPVAFVVCLISSALELTVTFILARLELSNIFGFISEGHNALSILRLTGVRESRYKSSFVGVVRRPVEFALSLLDVLAPLTRVLNTAIMREEFTLAVTLAFLPLADVAVAVVPGKFSFAFL